MLLKKLWRTAWQYKAPFISMVLLTAIGVGVFLGFQIEWRSIEYNTHAFLEDTRYADFRVYSETGFSEADRDAIADISGVEATVRYFQGNVSLQNTKKAVSLNVPESYTVSTMQITDGAAYNKHTDGIWLSDTFAAANDIRIGDTLTFTLQDIAISGQVMGLAKSGENLICVADENQLMPDYTAFGFAYMPPHMLEKALGQAFYPQIHIRSTMDKTALEKAIRQATGTSFLVVGKEDHRAYAGASSEVAEGKTMGSLLPVLFLAIAVLTMATTMHRITANEKVQIGTFKALGFRDARILRHYTSYGLLIGLIGSALGIPLGYGIAALIISPSGMMSTYLDLPRWDLVMPGFCLPVILLIILFLTCISFLSVKKMLKGTAADALRPYTPKAMKKSAVEKLPFWDTLSFSVKWNYRDILRHKARSAMTLFGVIGCTVLLLAGQGMKDTMEDFLHKMETDVHMYATKIAVSESAGNEDALRLAQDTTGDWQAVSGISYQGQTVSMEIYPPDVKKIGFLTEENQPLQLKSDGVYLCLRLKNTAAIGDTITISPYGSDTVYTVRVAGYHRSLVAENMVMTSAYADRVGIPYRISAVYTDTPARDIANSPLIAAKQDKQTIMDSYGTFMDLMNVMILLLTVAAMVLGIVVLYNLGIMSYVERHRELATLKVLGFRDKHLSRLLLSQNIGLTVIGLLVGLPTGVGVLQALIVSLASEYELSLCVCLSTYLTTAAFILGLSLLVGWLVTRRSKEVDMVEALKESD